MLPEKRDEILSDSLLVNQQDTKIIKKPTF